MSVRVRFAPSPTGPLHLGNARIAVINHLFALKEDGRFILRIEDTDEARFDPAAEHLIGRELEWLGIHPHEGPDIGGPFGPYRQSQRSELYTSTAERFLAEGLAYRCFCTDEMLADEKRRAVAASKPPRYSGRCRSLTDREIASRAGDPFTIRFRVSFSEIRIHDLIHGQVAFPSEAFGDFVILRADGSAVFIFSSAVDDCLMGITHVIRGEDHLPNTPRQILVHRALGKEPPAFAHVPLLLSESGDKIKKREGGFNLEALISDGYVPEGVVAYLAAVGNPTLTPKRAVSPDRIAQTFDIGRLGRSAVRVEPEKLARANALAIKTMPADDLASRLTPFLEAAGCDTGRVGRDTLVLFAQAVSENITTLADAAAYAPIFFSEMPPLDGVSRQILATDDARRVLEALLDKLAGVTRLTGQSYHSAVRAAADETRLGGRQLFAPIRAALTGMEHGPALEKIAEALGLDAVRRRIRAALRTPAENRGGK